MSSLIFPILYLVAMAKNQDNWLEFVLSQPSLLCSDFLDLNYKKYMNLLKDEHTNIYALYMKQ